MRPVVYDSRSFCASVAGRPHKLRAERPLTAEQQELVVANRALVYHVLHKHFSGPNSGRAVWHELKRAGLLGLCKAALGYTKSRGAFSTYAHWHVWGACKNMLRDLGRIPDHGGTLYGADDRYLAGSVPDHRTARPDVSAERAELNAIVADTFRFLDPRIAELIRLKHGLHGRPMLGEKEIAARLRISRRRVGQIYKANYPRFVRLLRERVEF